MRSTKKNERTLNKRGVSAKREGVKSKRRRVGSRRSVGSRSRARRRRPRGATGAHGEALGVLREALLRRGPRRARPRWERVVCFEDPRSGLALRVTARDCARRGSRRRVACVRRGSGAASCACFPRAVNASARRSRATTSRSSPRCALVSRSQLVPRTRRRAPFLRSLSLRLCAPGEGVLSSTRAREGQVRTHAWRATTSRSMQHPEVEQSTKGARCRRSPVCPR